MREAGLDETRFAEKMSSLVEKVDSGNDSEPKIFLEVLKEWSKHLEEAQGARAATPRVPVMVQLIHNVARPERQRAQAGKPPADRVPASDSPPAPDT